MIFTIGAQGADLSIRRLSRVNSNALRIGSRTKTDRTTVLNVTNLTYLNLSGRKQPSSILDYWVRINADKFAETDRGLIPTGRLAEVVGTPFYFHKFKRICEHIERVKESEALAFGEGHDHSFHLKSENSQDMRHAVTVKQVEDSGIVMDVWTTEPTVQFYAGNFLMYMLPAKEGEHYF
jgi:aldose 1-epimerase